MPARPDLSAPLIVVAHPDDEVLGFLSVLHRNASQSAAVLVCSEGATARSHYLRELFKTKRIRHAGFDDGPSDLDRPFNKCELASFLRKASPERISSVWSHSPADAHPQHCQVALAVSEVFGDYSIYYSHGINSSEYQYIADVCHPLSAAEIEQKIGILNTSYSDQAQYFRRWHSPGFSTESILSVESFVCLESSEVRRLYALRHSLTTEAATATDPWDFGTSRYELDRLDASTTWVCKWVYPRVHSIVEVGACEGALTERLLGAGFSRIVACEPNGEFRDRMVARLNDRVEVRDSTLEALSQGGPNADFYVLSEVLYYVADLAVLNRLPTKRLLVSANEQYVRKVVEPWIHSDRTWRIVDEQPLVEARVEFCVSNKVYCRKRGSHGLVLYRGDLEC